MSSSTNTARDALIQQRKKQTEKKVKPALSRPKPVATPASVGKKEFDLDAMLTMVEQTDKRKKDARRTHQEEYIRVRFTDPCEILKGETLSFILGGGWVEYFKQHGSVEKGFIPLPVHRMQQTVSLPDGNSVRIGLPLSMPVFMPTRRILHAGLKKGDRGSYVPVTPETYEQLTELYDDPSDAPWFHIRESGEHLFPQFRMDSEFKVHVMYGLEVGEKMSPLLSFFEGKKPREKGGSPDNGVFKDGENVLMYLNRLIKENEEVSKRLGHGRVVMAEYLDTTIRKPHKKDYNQSGFAELVVVRTPVVVPRAWRAKHEEWQEKAKERIRAHQEKVRKFYEQKDKARAEGKETDQSGEWKNVRRGKKVSRE